MGANFAPVYANLTMGYSEEMTIWADNPFSQYIFFYGRFIDDVLLIWSGGPNLSSAFVAYCNDNLLGLSFTHEIDQSELVFLDLVLSHDKDTIITSNHKPTSGNSYLHYTSCTSTSCGRLISLMANSTDCVGTILKQKTI